MWYFPAIQQYAAQQRRETNAEQQNSFPNQDLLLFILT
jgi:hypothetical protein